MRKKLLIIGSLIGCIWSTNFALGEEPPFACSTAELIDQNNLSCMQTSVLKAMDKPPGLIDDFARNTCNAFFLSPYAGTYKGADHKVHVKSVQKSQAKYNACVNEDGLTKGMDFPNLPKSTKNGECLHYVRNILNRMFGATFCSGDASAKGAAKDLSANGFNPEYTRQEGDKAIGPSPDPGKLEIRVYSGGNAHSKKDCGKLPCGHIEICYLGSCTSDYNLDRPLNEEDAISHSPHPHVLTSVYTLSSWTPLIAGKAPALPDCSNQPFPISRQPAGVKKP